MKRKRKRSEWKIDVDFKYVFEVLLTSLFVICTTIFMPAAILMALVLYPVSTLITVFILCSFAIGWSLVEEER